MINKSEREGPKQLLKSFYNQSIKNLFREDDYNYRVNGKFLKKRAVPFRDKGTY